jgi:tRNA nucleotidyltransferase (CCA-adding enzyme)
MEVYLVGGAVRDQLLGLEVGERDWVVTGATPAQMSDAGYRPVGKDFPVFLHPQSKEEYALARTERKSGHGYAGFEFFTSPDTTLEQDLERRDLTINAIAKAGDGRLIDPFNGQQDLQQRLLRHVSDAFVEDPLRVLRVARFAARFAAYGFRVAPETMALMQHIAASGELDYLVPERVWQETSKALASDRPEVYFQVLRECNALASIMPELDRLFGVAQPPQHHPEIDTGIHSLMVLQQAALLSGHTRVRFAALVHDLGKGVTPAAQLPQHIAHEHRGISIIKGLCQRLRVPNDHRDLGLLCCRHHGQVHRILEARDSTVLKLLGATDAIRRPGRFAELLQCCEADSRGRSGFEQRPYPQAGFLLAALAAASAVDHRALMAQGLSGKQLGERIASKRIEAIHQLPRPGLRSL